MRNNKRNTAMANVLLWLLHYRGRIWVVHRPRYKQPPNLYPYNGAEIILLLHTNSSFCSFTLLSSLIPCHLIYCISAIMHWDTMVPPDHTILLEDTVTGKNYLNIVINTYILFRIPTSNFERAPVYQLAFTNSAIPNVIP